MVLFISSSQKTSSFAITDNSGKTIISSNLIADLSAQQIPSAFHKAMNEYKISIKNCQKIIVDIGPGSFTGIRSGIAYVIGLSLPLAIPVIGMSCFDAMQQSLLERDKMNDKYSKIYLLIKSSKTQYYVKIINNVTNTAIETTMSEEEVDIIKQDRKNKFISSQEEEFKINASLFIKAFASQNRENITKAIIEPHYISQPNLTTKNYVTNKNI